MSIFAGMTYEEAVEAVAKETADVIFALLDGETNMKDFMETVEAGKAWNAAVHLGLDKKVLWGHVLANLGKIGVNQALPLPTGTIPA